MKKIFILFILLILNVCSVKAEKLPSNFKILDNNAKIFYDEETRSWTDKLPKNQNKYFIKTNLNDNFSYYSPSDNSNGFSTNCNFEFLKNNKLIGYSNNELKFYEFNIIDSVLSKEELTFEEVKKLLPDYKIIKISDLNNNTNSIKIKKHLKKLDLLVYNDTDKIFENYTFTSGNSKIKVYKMSGFVTITQKGMIQFSGGFINTKETPWYIILVR